MCEDSASFAGSCEHVFLLSSTNCLLRINDGLYREEEGASQTHTHTHTQ